MIRLARCLFALWILASLVGCAAIEEELERRKPEATVESVRVTGIGFDAADLALDVRIDNPNPIAIDLAGFDYDVRLAGQSVLAGQRDRRVEIPADDSRRIEVPLHVVYERVYRAVEGLADRDEVDYAVDLVLRVDLPALGLREVPIEASGRLPVPRRPDVRVEGLRIEGLGWSEARLVLELAVNNPNAFGLALRELDYGLRVNGQEWASGRTREASEIPARGTGRLALPFGLDFSAMGSQARNLLTGTGEVEYTLEGSLAGTAGSDLLGDFELPFDRSGRLSPGR